MRWPPSGDHGPPTSPRVASAPAAAYLDASALVKLIAVEPETVALRRELSRWPRRVTSLLARVEVTRTADRIGGQAPALAPGVMSRLQLLAIDPVVPAAAQIGGTTLRSLDAIHLATALGIAHELGALITYDLRMIAEGEALGLPILSPS